MPLTPPVAYLFLLRPMAHESRRSLELQVIVALPLLFALIFPMVIAQHSGLVWLHAIAICVALLCGVVVLRAAILLKPYRDLAPAVSKRLWRVSAFVIALILSCGFGSVALRAQTWHAWLIWAAFTAPLVSLLYHELRDKV